MLIEGYEYDIVAEAYNEFKEGLIDISEMNFTDFKAFVAYEKSIRSVVEDYALALSSTPKEFDATDISMDIWESIFLEEETTELVPGVHTSKHFMKHFKHLASAAKDPKHPEHKGAKESLAHVTNTIHSVAKHGLDGKHGLRVNDSHMKVDHSTGKKVEAKDTASQKAKKMGLKHIHVHNQGGTNNHVIMASKHPSGKGTVLHAIATHGAHGSRSKHLPDIKKAKADISRHH